MKISEMMLWIACTTLIAISVATLSWGGYDRGEIRLSLAAAPWPASARQIPLPPPDTESIDGYPYVLSVLDTGDPHEQGPDQGTR